MVWRGRSKSGLNKLWKDVIKLSTVHQCRLWICVSDSASGGGSLVIMTGCCHSSMSYISIAWLQRRLRQALGAQTESLSPAFPCRDHQSVLAILSWPLQTLGLYYFFAWRKVKKAHRDGHVCPSAMAQFQYPWTSSDEFWHAYSVIAPLQTAICDF